MYVFIINPVAGSGKTLRIMGRLVQYMRKHGIHYTVLATEEPGQATILAKHVARIGKADAVIAVGGDGTVFESACGLMGTDMPLGIIPAGTGNDFIKTVGIPKKSRDALEFIISHKARPIDIGKAGDRFFMNVCGTGFDVDTLHKAEPIKKVFHHGMMPYMFGVARAISSYRPTHLKIDADGEIIEGDYFIAAFGNAQYYGGGLRVCPKAVPDDGMLDLVLIGDAPKRLLPYGLYKLKIGDTSHRLFMTRRCREYHIMREEIEMDLDGDCFKMSEPVIKAMPHALKLFW